MVVTAHGEFLIGTVERVTGNAIEFHATRAADHSLSAFGERFARGEVGEFVLVQTEGVVLLARIEELRLGRERLSGAVSSNAPVIARAALLASLDSDSAERRGISRHPRIGDQVYSAPAATLGRVVSHASGEATDIALGVLSRHPDAEAVVSAPALLGRHLAVVGTTGSGKSWTLAALVERLGRSDVRVLLIDATGEFSSLGSAARHVNVARPRDDGGEYARLDHVRLDEPDLFRLLQPAPGSQIPKLRSALASLKLATEDGLADARGCLVKIGRPLVEVEREMHTFFGRGNARSKAWSFKALPDQLREECFKEGTNGRLQSDAFVVGHVGTLIARVHDLLHHESRHDVFAELGSGTPTLLDVVDGWLESTAPRVLRVALDEVPFALELRELVANVIGRHLLQSARAGKFRDHALVVVLDEAHQFLKTVRSDDGLRFSFDAFGSIAKEGRKYGLHLVAATQRPGDLPPDVISQMGALLVHRLADRRDREYVEQAASDVDRSALDLLPSLVPGEALLMGVDFPVPVTIRVHAPSRPPAYVAPPFAPRVRA